MMIEKQRNKVNDAISRKQLLDALEKLTAYDYGKQTGDVHMLVRKIDVYTMIAGIQPYKGDI